jgi:thioredoxin 1
MSALTVNDQNFHDEVLESTTPVLVDFWAPWCGPCRMMSPVVDELASDLGDQAKVVKINVDDAAETAAKYGVRSIPTFAVIKNGEVQRQFGGVQTKDALREAIDS